LLEIERGDRDRTPETGASQRPLTSANGAKRRLDDEVSNQESRPERVVQYSRKRRRCRRRTVSGATITSATTHPAHTLDSRSQIR
jgi:hypothetical protein